MIRRVVGGLNIQIYQKRNNMNKDAIFLSTRLSLFNFSTPLSFLPHFRLILILKSKSDVMSDVFPHALLFGR